MNEKSVYPYASDMFQSLQQCMTREQMICLDFIANVFGPSPEMVTSSKRKIVSHRRQSGYSQLKIKARFSVPQYFD